MLKILHTKPACKLTHVDSELLSNVLLMEKNKDRFSRYMVSIKLFTLLYS